MNCSNANKALIGLRRKLIEANKTVNDINKVFEEKTTENSEYGQLHAALIRLKFPAIEEIASEMQNITKNSGLAKNLTQF